MNVRIQYQVQLKNNNIIDGYHMTKIGTTIQDFKIAVLDK